MPPPCWRCWRPCWWCWRPWRWSWSLDGCWRSPRWVEEALMTHSVVIHAMMMSWVLGRRSGKPTCDVLMYLDHRGPRAWLRWLKKPMMPLAWWRSLWTHICWVNGPWTFEGDDMVTFGWWGPWSHMSWCWDSLMKPLMAWYTLACDGLGLEPTYWQLDDGTNTQAHKQVNSPKRIKKGGQVGSTKEDCDKSAQQKW